MILVVAAAREAMRHAGGIFADLGRELADLSLSGPRARLCAATSLAVVASVVVASALHLPEPWWAALSAFRSVMATRPASFQRAGLRIAGTVAGAAAAVVLLPALAYDPVAYALVLWLVAAIGLLGFALSSNGYSFLFAAITFALVTLISLQDPPAAFGYACLRVLEVSVGCAVGVVVAWMLQPDDDAAAEAAPGWNDLLGAKFPAVLHAVRAGFAVASVPFIWMWLDLPSLAQMPITVAMVMAVPFATTGDPAGRDRAVLTKSLHRLIGCLLGGLAGLAVLPLAVGGFAFLLAWLGAGMWIGTHVQIGTRGVGYVGLQGAMAFLLTLIQGLGPPESILPGIDRLAGIFCGLVIMLAVTAVLEYLAAPTQGEPSPATAGG